MERYASLWGVRKGSVSAPQPCSIDHTNLNLLTTRPYMVSWKTDGVRKVLYAHEDRCLYWVDRSGTFERAEGTAEPNVFAGTVLDGELMDQGTRFVVFDCVAITGTQVHRKSLPHRLLHAATACRLIRMPHVRLETKPTVCATNLLRLLRLQGVEKNDGLVFTPTYRPVETRGTSRDTLKWKPRRLHTVDLWLCASNEQLRYTLTTEDGHEVNTVTFAEADPLSVITQARLVECEWNGTNFVPIMQNKLLKTRHDKPRANTKYVVDRTVEAIRDNITLDTLLEMRYKRS